MIGLLVNISGRIGSLISELISSFVHVSELVGSLVHVSENIGVLVDMSELIWL